MEDGKGVSRSGESRLAGPEWQVLGRTGTEIGLVDKVVRLEGTRKFGQ